MSFTALNTRKLIPKILDKGRLELAITVLILKAIHCTERNYNEFNYGIVVRNEHSLGHKQCCIQYPHYICMQWWNTEGLTKGWNKACRYTTCD